MSESYDKLQYNEKQKLPDRAKQLQSLIGKGKINIPNTNKHDHSPSWLGSDNPVKCRGVKLQFLGHN